ncbi:MAG: hypothetical protein PHF66_07035 [Desulfobacteraceae bacterium]|jgi:hypothetical protein|nr:hypothetical protein [Desulfobacteraceae bacterium]
MKFKIGAAVGLICMVWMATVGAMDQPEGPRIEISSQTHSFDPVAEGETVVHDFVVRNTGTADLEIYKVRTG